MLFLAGLVVGGTVGFLIAAVLTVSVIAELQTEIERERERACRRQGNGC